MSVGSITKKGTDYRKTLMNKVKGDRNHPINQGIHMEAHHLISEEGIKLARIGNTLKDSGYNINDDKNLIFLPATLPGACHLEVQLHRGDHFGPDPWAEQEDDDDDHHHISYHMEVRDLLLALERQIDDCRGDCSSTANKLQKMLNRTSSSIAKKIQRYQVPLSVIYKSFKNGKSMGCGNCIDIVEHRSDAINCQSDRDHHGEEHPKFRSGKFKQTITRQKSAYTLRAAQ